jgi:hypothetical protein
VVCVLLVVGRGCSLEDRVVGRAPIVWCGSRVMSLGVVGQEGAAVDQCGRLAQGGPSLWS